MCLVLGFKDGAGGEEATLTCGIWMEMVVEDGKASLWVEHSFVFLKAFNRWPCHLALYPSAFPTQQPVPGGQDGDFSHPWATPDPGLGTQKALRSIC